MTTTTSATEVVVGVLDVQPRVITGTEQTSPASTGKSMSRRFIRQALEAFIATHPTRADRAAQALAELDDIAIDRTMADRLPDPGSWLAELLAEERDVWDRISELLST
jgi:hypothetical protein